MFKNEKKKQYIKSLKQADEEHYLFGKLSCKIGLIFYIFLSFLILKKDLSEKELKIMT